MEERLFDSRKQAHNNNRQLLPWLGQVTSTHVRLTDDDANSNTNYKDVVFRSKRGLLVLHSSASQDCTYLVLVLVANATQKTVMTSAST